MSLPSNIHISTHPCLQAKLSQLRSQNTTPRETRALVEEIASILGVEAFAQGLTLTKTGTVCLYTPFFFSFSCRGSPSVANREVFNSPQDRTPLGIEYETSSIDPADLALVPILRSGLGMVDGMTIFLLLFYYECQTYWTSQSTTHPHPHPLSPPHPSPLYPNTSNHSQL